MGNLFLFSDRIESRILTDVRKDRQLGLILVVEIKNFANFYQKRRRSSKQSS